VCYLKRADGEDGRDQQSDKDDRYFSPQAHRSPGSLAAWKEAKAIVDFFGEFLNTLLVLRPISNLTDYRSRPTADDLSFYARFARRIPGFRPSERRDSLRGTRRMTAYPYKGIYGTQH
jgi:hypothetical protein